MKIPEKLNELYEIYNNIQSRVDLYNITSVELESLSLDTIYTKINSDATAGSSQQMPGMKVVMYLMPLMFLVFFNEYSSGLSYYYFISTLFTIFQTYLFRAFVNEKKLLLQLNENKKKPLKKSKFADKLEKMQKQQLEMQKQQRNRK